MSVEFAKMTMPISQAVTEYQPPPSIDRYMDYFGVPFMQGHYTIPFAPNNTASKYGTGPLALPKPHITADFFEFESFYEIFADLPGKLAHLK